MKDELKQSDDYGPSLSARLWQLAEHHATEAGISRACYAPGLSRYHEGKAFAYEHAARMLDGTDAS